MLNQMSVVELSGIYIDYKHSWSMLKNGFFIKLSMAYSTTIIAKIKEIPGHFFPNIPRTLSDQKHKSTSSDDEYITLECNTH